MNSHAPQDSASSAPAFLTLLLEKIPAFVWATDADLRVTFLEGGALAEMGIGDDEIARLVGTRGESLLGADATQIIERFQVLLQGESVRFELPFRGRWYSLHAEPLRDSSGTIIGSIGVGADTSERHELAEELIKERDALSETQKLAELGTWSRDLSSNRMTISQELSRILGIAYTKEPVPFEHLLELLHPDDRSRVLDELTSALATKQRFRLDHRIVQPDGTVRHVGTQGAFEFDESGNAVRCLGSMIDVTDRVEAQLSAEHLAYHDSLTGLPNRLLLADRVAQSIARSQREHRTFYVVFLDLDHFKDINDRLGHAEGDCLLIEVTNRLQRATRTSDTVARTGGDEFVIVLSNAMDDEHLDATIQKLRGVFAHPFTLYDGEHYITASLGIATYPDDGITAEDLLKNADAAMYEAKRAGRNRVRHYVRASTETNIRRMQLEADLMPALKGAEFYMQYQPIVNAQTLQLEGVEALVRWQHPTLGLLHPEQFIPLAEHSDRILVLGRWIIEDACATLAVLQRQVNPNLRLSVNVSPRQIVNTDHLVKTLEHSLASNGVDAQALELELTENALLREFEAAVGLVSQIRDLGIGIAIDDFGTGYNSFAYLKHFPVTTLKIDRLFVSGDGNPFDEAISGAIATLGKSLGLRVTAEGVETEGQCALLQSLGCDSLQGFYFAPPMPPSELIERYAVHA